MNMKKVLMGGVAALMLATSGMNASKEKGAEDEIVVLSKNELNLTEINKIIESGGVKSYKSVLMEDYYGEGEHFTFSNLYDIVVENSPDAFLELFGMNREEKISFKSKKGLPDLILSAVRVIGGFDGVYRPQIEKLSEEKEELENELSLMTEKVAEIGKKIQEQDEQSKKRKKVEKDSDHPVQKEIAKKKQESKKTSKVQTQTPVEDDDDEEESSEDLSIRETRPQKTHKQKGRKDQPQTQNMKPKRYHG